MGSAEAADRGHRRSELQKQARAVQYEEGHPGTEQGLFPVRPNLSHRECFAGNSEAFDLMCKSLYTLPE